MAISPLLPHVLVEKIILSVILLRLLPILIALLRLSSMETTMKAIILSVILCMRLVVVLESTSLLVLTWVAALLVGTLGLLTLAAASCIIVALYIFIGKNIISSSDLLKLLFITFFASGCIWVVFLCELIELFLDLSLRGILSKTQLPVVVNIWIEAHIRCKGTGRSKNAQGLGD